MKVKISHKLLDLPLTPLSQAFRNIIAADRDVVWELVYLSDRDGVVVTDTRMTFISQILTTEAAKKFTMEV